MCLSPLRGSLAVDFLPTACAVGCILAPRRGFLWARYSTLLASKVATPSRLAIGRFKSLQLIPVSARPRQPAEEHVDQGEHDRTHESGAESIYVKAGYYR